MNTPDSFETAMNHYNDPRADGDIDLIAVVRDILTSNGLSQKIPLGYDNNMFIKEASNKTSVVQRHLLNRYWNQQLMLTSKPTTEERYCLIPNGETKDWLQLFTSKIMPFILDNDLPIAR